MWYTGIEWGLSATPAASLAHSRRIYNNLQNKLEILKVSEDHDHGPWTMDQGTQGPGPTPPPRGDSDNHSNSLEIGNHKINSNHKIIIEIGSSLVEPFGIS